MSIFNFSVFRSLSKSDEDELAAQHTVEIRELLPILGPTFGLVVLLFNIWDHLVDPDHAGTTLLVRIVLVALGSIAYFDTRLSWTAIERCGLIYWTHVSAIVLSEYLLRDGFLYGVSGISACIFMASVMTYRIRTFLKILSLPSILFCTLIAFNRDNFVVVNGLMMYVFAFGIASSVMLVSRSFRHKNLIIERQLLHLSRHDGLTGVNNRAYLTELGEHLFALAKRHGRPLAIALLDIDHFKNVNDNYGHDIGDKVICTLSNTCIAQLRQIDHFGRIGGEEFACILPETDAASALLCMERLRLGVAALSVETPTGVVQFTISIGIALLDDTHANWLALLKDADTAMYQAKNSGRNRCLLFSTASMNKVS